LDAAGKVVSLVRGLGGLASGAWGWLSRRRTDDRVFQAFREAWTEAREKSASLGVTVSTLEVARRTGLTLHRVALTLIRLERAGLLRRGWGGLLDPASEPRE
jgi:hypothetical protein